MNFQMLSHSTPQKTIKHPILLAGLIALVFILLCASPAGAHHILGIPHYAYEEEYPQTPVLTFTVTAGPHEVKMTSYPGNPQPGEACSIHLYITRRDSGAPFDGEVVLSVFKDRLLGEGPVIYGPVEGHLEEAMYKFYPRFDEEANYVVRVAFEADGEHWIIDMPMVAGEPGSPWATLGLFAGGLIVFVVVIRAARIKLQRLAKSGERPQPVAGRSEATP